MSSSVACTSNFPANYYECEIRTHEGTPFTISSLPVTGIIISGGLYEDNNGVKGNILRMLTDSVFIPDTNDFEIINENTIRVKYEGQTYLTTNATRCYNGYVPDPLP